MVADLGGAITTTQEAVLDMAMMKRVLINKVGRTILENDWSIDKPSRRVLPIVREWFSLAESLEKSMVVLGLERKAKPPKDLHTYIQETYDVPVTTTRDTGEDEDGHKRRARGAPS